MKTWARRRLVLVSVILLLLIAVTAVISLKNDDSTLSVLVRVGREEMGWSADTTGSAVLRRMGRMLKRGDIDEAIGIGRGWAQKHPGTFISTQTAALCIMQASKDPQHTDSYVKQALELRDAALPSVSDSSWELSTYASISEGAGDLSPSQRCVQYRNAVKLLRRASSLENDRKAEIARHIVMTKEDSITMEKLQSSLQSFDVQIARLQQKSQSSDCE